MDLGMITIILAAALAVSEALALIPGLQSNGILSALIGTLKKIVRSDDEE